MQLDLRKHLPYLLWKVVAWTVAVVLGLPYLGLVFVSTLVRQRSQRPAGVLHRTLDIFHRAGAIGQIAFSQFVGFYAPYAASVDPFLESYQPGWMRASIVQHRGIQNPFQSIHACALANLGELVTTGAFLTLITRDPAAAARNRAIPIGMRLEFVKKARGKIVAECRATLPDRVEGRGKFQHEVSCHLLNEAGEVVSKMWINFQVELQ